MITDNLHVEKITGTGAAIEVKPGFKPRYIRILNTDGVCTLEWATGMAAAAGYKIVGATQSLISSGGITLAADGLTFTIGADADINVSGESITVMAFK